MRNNFDYIWLKIQANSCEETYHSKKIMWINDISYDKEDSRDSTMKLSTLSDQEWKVGFQISMSLILLFYLKLSIVWHFLNILLVWKSHIDSFLDCHDSKMSFLFFCQTRTCARKLYQAYLNIYMYQIFLIPYLKCLNLQS